MEGELLKGLGERVAARRKSLGLTQEQVAEELDVSVQMISNLECGRKAVRLPNLIKLSELLNISCDYILTGKRAKGDFENLSAHISKLSEEDYNMIKVIVNYCINEKYRTPKI